MDPPQNTTYPNHPPPMYYPNPNVPYPQYQNTYPYHYPQTAPYYGPPPTYQNSGFGARFVRSFIVCFIMILTFFFLISLIVSLVLRPELPVYKVASLSVTNFTTTPTLTGQWDIKITVENPNEKLVGYFSDFRVDVMFKDGIMAISHASGFVLGTKNHSDVHVEGFSNQAIVTMMEKATMDDLVKERGTNSVTVTLRVSSVNMFKAGTFSTRRAAMVALCNGLTLVFQNTNATTGALDNKGGPVQCQLYI
ncbi:hypothetical protein VNO78_21124 [Psophocarpus tetragonolobus]|uniref:Late embryogenesis abundant protein LEA-2 subgroup domain-containing protein n=1 Tax=Psophocarpus tetragonolobus TaxID=3891 RepID=A0AAN9XHR8_PSOTE